MNNIFRLLNDRIQDMKQLIKFNKVSVDKKNSNKEEYIRQFRLIKNNEKKRTVIEDNLFDVAKNIVEFNEQTLEQFTISISFLISDITNRYIYIESSKLMLLLDVNFRSNIVFSYKLKDIVELYIEFFNKIDLKNQLQELNDFKSNYDQSVIFYFMELKMFIQVCKKILNNLIREFYRNYFDPSQGYNMVINRKPQQTQAVHTNSTQRQVVWIVKHNSQQKENQYQQQHQQQHQQQQQPQPQQQQQQQQINNRIQMNSNKQQIQMSQTSRNINGQQNLNLISNKQQLIQNIKKEQWKQTLNTKQITVSTESETFYQKSVRRIEEKKKKELKIQEMLNIYDVNQQFDLKTIFNEMVYKNYNMMYRNIEGRNQLIIRNNAEIHKKIRTRQKVEGGWTKYMYETSEPVQISRNYHRTLQRQKSDDYQNKGSDQVQLHKQNYSLMTQNTQNSQNYKVQQ